MTNRDFNNANRPLMAAVCFAAAMFLSACGGSGGGDGSRLDSTVPFSERNGGPGSESSGAGEEAQDVVSEKGAAEQDSTDQSTTEQSTAETVEPGATQQSSPSETTTNEVSSKGVVLRWSVPTHRHNGQPLDRDELGGYEVRYREASESQFRTIPIRNGMEHQFAFEEELNGDYEFQVAAYDVNGLYSEFVSLTPFEEG